MKKNIFVVAAVIVKDGSILCAQRNRNKTLALKWEFPGGKIESGETQEEALVREIKEELSCCIKVGKKIISTTHSYDFATIHLTAFLCTLSDDKILLNEHEALKWLNPNELNTLDWSEADKPIVKHIEKLFL